jgi:DtxR family Mn-dependent transcriptional regulator
MVNYKPYGYVTLTDIGRQQASRVARKHDIIKSFFVDILGVEKSIASVAACKAEHALGPQIVTRLLSFIEFVTHNNNNGFDLADQFRKFCQENDKENIDGAIK